MRTTPKPQMNLIQRDKTGISHIRHYTTNNNDNALSEPISESKSSKPPEGPKDDIEFLEPVSKAPWLTSTSPDHEDWLRQRPIPGSTQPPLHPSSISNEVIMSPLAELLKQTTEYKSIVNALMRDSIPKCIDKLVVKIDDDDDGMNRILQKHIKRQIISLNGGFQVIADLNTYHAFISSLKVPSIASDFSHLKMLGHVYVVEDAKDLAQIVRDVTRYGGAYRPEDIYEFIQRRSDWKKIEKTVDKAMYNLSFKEDCIVC
ncbi:hypothetical protein P691DRAFT_774549 [Macrolepiota fuliginosa MF-IS2]|uniref:Exocyst complex component Sec10-like alpha-helical bundle domain-containing protein n=1 Tax=Macrolepiota fuliginosa MF-IS2 TaxID=1400762 RepID=A0A9P5XDY7_9AGAR|nr:hypothetical protein P691DRAFT_774549 [Macrolepiota fuliginosa MF-IS2]